MPKPIPLNLRSLYEDITRRVLAADVPPASIVTRTSKGHAYLHAVIRDGAVRRSIHLGRADDPQAQTLADRYRRANRQAKDTRKSIQALTRSSGVTVWPVYGRLLEVLANAGLFKKGMVLVGTVAFQQYSWLLGVHLTDGAARTEDADISIARLAVRSIQSDEPLDAILRRADPSFEPDWKQGDILPKAFSSDHLAVEILTTMGRTEGHLQIPSLKCAAVPLKYMEYLIADPLEIVALHGAGVAITVPDPARYAIHKLLIERGPYSSKAEKDVLQAAELIAVLRKNEPDRLAHALADARKRGPAWRRRLDARLDQLELRGASDDRGHRC